MRRAPLLLLLAALPAFAEGGWLSARGRLQPELRLEAWAGNLSFGAGVVAPDAGNVRAALLIEALYAFRDRTIELRGGRVWQLTANRFATASATLSGAAYVVPEGFDLGIGPHGTLSLALGGRVFTVDLSLETGAELFFRARVARLPQRGVLGLNLRIADFGLSAQAKLGADVVPGANPVGRGELMLSFSWFPAGSSAPR
jgi:hypothetical protein